MIGIRRRWLGTGIGVLLGVLLWLLAQVGALYHGGAGAWTPAG